MALDLIIRNGTVVDGTGAPGYRADVGLVADRIVAIGDLSAEAAAESIDAAGHVVSPGFIDGHTHMDAQVFWDPLGTCSSWHGVTTVLMGNCGFTLAPCAERDRAFVIRNLERAEDISRDAMEAGITWSWETFPQFLDTLERLPKGINYGAYIGHSALRTYAMRERAFTDEASQADLDVMKREVRSALKAGAWGLTTSRSKAHRTPDNSPVASRLADWSEVEQLVGVLGEERRGVFEIAAESSTNDREVMGEWMARLKALALNSGVPVTFGIGSQKEFPDVWRTYLGIAEETAREGGQMLVQTSGRPLNTVLSFQTTTPFDRSPAWAELRAKPRDEQIRILRDPAQRESLVRAAHALVVQPEDVAGPEARQADYDAIFVVDKPYPPYRSVAQVSQETGRDPVDVMIDLALETDFQQFFFQVFASGDEAHVAEMITHPHSVVTFSDSGAHVSQLIDASIQTNLLGYWVRQRRIMSLEQAIKRMTADLADFWGLQDRGRVTKGAIADLVVFDPETIGPTMPEVVQDLPAGATRLIQKAHGILLSIVGGRVLMRKNEKTGVLDHAGGFPGRLLRCEART